MKAERYLPKHVKRVSLMMLAARFSASMAGP
jgi:hypothetical protein